MSQVTRMREELRETVGELHKVRERLLRLRDGVPPAAEALERDGDAEPDPLAEMAAAIECGVHDGLDPLIRDLLAAADREA